MANIRALFATSLSPSCCVGDNYRTSAEVVKVIARFKPSACLFVALSAKLPLPAQNLSKVTCYLFGRVP